MKHEPQPPPRSKEIQWKHYTKIPKGSILADHSQQAPNNSYSPPVYYADRAFTCRHCGSEEVWTAESQWKYYEVWKKPIFGAAVLCRSCRIKERDKRAENKRKSELKMKHKKQH